MRHSNFTTDHRRKTGCCQLLTALIFLLLTGISSSAYSQQFNSDNWWVVPHGVGTGVATIGEKYSTMYLGYGFAPGWEVDIAPTIYEEDPVSGAAARYSTTAYVKGLIWENQEQTSGASVMAGIGQSPGYYQSGTKTNDFKSYWAALPITLPFLDNTISWDIMPGVLYNREYGINEESAWGFSYSTRIAIYKIIPQSAIVAEVFGATGDAEAEAQYKAGVRWESKYVIAALTYGDGLEGNEGGGIELGFIILTVPWF
jgi:hypothetical protein